MTPPSPALFCIGYGYCAQVFVRRCAASGASIHATARSEDKRALLEAAGVTAHPWPLASLDAIPQGAQVLASAPPTAAGDPFLTAFGDELAARPDLAWIGYLSTTSVYGDQGGAWVDETDAPAPTSGRGERRVVAEQAWRAHGAHIFRLAGIYGPGRSPFEKIRSETARRVIKPGQVFGRIHVADIAAVLAASIQQPNPGAVYNVTDDLPAPPQDVLTYAAELIGRPPPPEIAFDDADLSPMARSFYAECKRVRNDRIKQELGVTLAYPTYREGLAALVA